MDPLSMSLDEIISKNKEQRKKERQVKQHKKVPKHTKAAPFKKSGAKQPEKKPAGPNKTLFVTNLHFNVSNEALRELFSKVGPLKRCGINWDNLGRSKGTAEVEFLKHEDAATALETLNSTKLEDQEIALKWARAKKVNKAK